MTEVGSFLLASTLAKAGFLWKECRSETGSQAGSAASIFEACCQKLPNTLVFKCVWLRWVVVYWVFYNLLYITSKQLCFFTFTHIYFLCPVELYPDFAGFVLVLHFIFPDEMTCNHGPWTCLLWLTLTLINARTKKFTRQRDSVNLLSQGGSPCCFIHVHSTYKICYRTVGMSYHDMAHRKVLTMLQLHDCQLQGDFPWSKTLLMNRWIKIGFCPACIFLKGGSSAHICPKKNRSCRSWNHKFQETFPRFSPLQQPEGLGLAKSMMFCKNLLHI